MDLRKYAVIGSNAFSGSDFIDLLLEDERNQVLGISRSPEKSGLFLPYLRHGRERFQFVQADLNTQLPALLEALDRFEPEAVVNFAAQSEVGPSWEHPDQWYQTNVVALARLAHALKDRPWLRRYLHISSPEVYGTCSGRVTEDAPLLPSTPYAASKAAADLHLATLARHMGFPVVTVRSTNVYGAHQQLFKLIPRALIRLKREEPILLHGGGRAVKSYIHIRDISRGELAVLRHGVLGAIYHLSPEQGVSVRDVVRRLCELQGRDPSTVVQDVEERLGQDRAYVIDATRARIELGWKPDIPLEQGLAEVAEWVEGEWERIQKEPMDYVHKA